MDLAQGYFHIPVFHVLQKIFSFEVRGRRYKYNCLPQSWSSHAIAFPSRMLQALEMTKVVVFVDDLLVGGSPMEEDDNDLRQVFLRLEQMGMHINPGKLVAG